MFIVYYFFWKHVLEKARENWIARMDDRRGAIHRMDHVTRCKKRRSENQRSQENWLQATHELNKILLRKVWLVESERYQEKKKIVRGKDNTGFRGDSLLLLSSSCPIFAISRFHAKRIAYWVRRALFGWPTCHTAVSTHQGPEQQKQGSEQPATKTRMERTSRKKNCEGRPRLEAVFFYEVTAKVGQYVGQGGVFPHSPSLTVDLKFMFPILLPFANSFEASSRKKGPSLSKSALPLRKSACSQFFFTAKKTWRGGTHPTRTSANESQQQLPSDRHTAEKNLEREKL